MSPRSTKTHALRELEKLKAHLDDVLEHGSGEIEGESLPIERAERCEPLLSPAPSTPHLSFESALRALRPQVAEGMLLPRARRLYDQRPAPEIHVVASRVIEAG